jgi:hypothetical protein
MLDRTLLGIQAGQFICGKGYMQKEIDPHALSE